MLLTLSAISLLGCNFGLTKIDTGSSDTASPGPLGGQTSLDSGDDGGDGDDGGPGADIGDGGEDTAPPEDTEPPEDTSPPEDTEPPADNAPTIVSFSATESGNQIRFEFKAADIDEDLDGGTATLSVSGTSVTYDYPDDFYVDPDNVASLNWDGTSYIRETSYIALLVVADARGNRSETAEDNFIRGPWTTSVSEGGDGFATATSIGEIELPAEISGEIYGQGDQDWMRFRVPRDGTRSFRLTWSTSGADYDLYLYDDGGSLLNQSESVSTSESFDEYLNTGNNYYVMVNGYSDDAGSWTLRID
jgi:hypothetical protein